MIYIQTTDVGETLDISIPSPEVLRTPALLYEMMRSFTALARTLNLSQAVEDLGSTRQTVRRHISQLEEAMGVKLFEVQQRRYLLTEAGARAVAPAQLLLDQGGIWYQGLFQNVGGMLRFSSGANPDWAYHQQQLPLSLAWSVRSKLLGAAIKAWAQSEGKLESKEMAHVRPYMLAYRENSEGWICVEVGEKSFYSNYFGWAQARSSVGRNLNQFPGGEEFASLANAPFADIKSCHGIRLDQVVSRLRLSPEGEMQTVAFDRLLMGVQMPDGSPAIVSVVDRPCEIRITDLDPGVLDMVAPRAKVDFDG